MYFTSKSQKGMESIQMYLHVFEYVEPDDILNECIFWPWRQEKSPDTICSETRYFFAFKRR